jgi:hypothetical protein
VILVDVQVALGTIPVEDGVPELLQCTLNHLTFHVALVYYFGIWLIRQFSAPSIFFLISKLHSRTRLA